MNQDNNANKNSETSYYSLNKIIGFGSYNNFSISVNQQNGLTCYITGPFITFYDLKKDKAVYYYKNTNNRAFSCLTFSDNGCYLACGEGYCTRSEIFIIDVSKILKAENTNHNLNNFSSNIPSSALIKLTLKGGHKLSTEKLRFFKNDKYLISIGDREDKYLNIWSLDYNKNSYEIAFTMKFKRYIISFDVFDRTIVMGGDKFLKIWTLDEKENSTSTNNTNSNNNVPNATGKSTDKDSTANQSTFTITKHTIETGKLRDKVFNVCKIQQNKTFILSSDGHLIELDNELKEISRWVNLKTEKALSLTIHQENLICGCSEGIIRIFNCNTLQYKSTLHRPPPLGKANIDSNTKKINISVTNEERFADVICLVFNPFYEKLISLYSDKTFFIWDLCKAEKIYVYRYNTFHSGSVNSMDCAYDEKEDVMHFVTCSDDKTVRLWNMRYEDFAQQGKEESNRTLRAEAKKLDHIAYSKFCRRIFYFGKKFDHFKTKETEIINGLNKINNPKYNESELGDITETEEEEISYVKFSPDLKYLACGDNYGNLYIYDMKTLNQLNFVNLHNNQITCIDFFSSEVYSEKGLSAGSNPIYYLATGSLDNLVHIFDIQTEEKIKMPFQSLEKITLNDHEAPITGLIFNIPNLTPKNQQNINTTNTHNNILNNLNNLGQNLSNISQTNTNSTNINNSNIANYNSNSNLILSVNLITFSIDNKINFYCINSIKSIQHLQSYVEDNLQTYSMNWNFDTNKIITGHNGKISVWKTYGCRPYKIFDVKLRNNVIEHFRIALDQTGKIIATSCNDKFIRIRSAFDGQLFCKIPIAESVSSLSFCAKNEFLLASSIEGYVYFFRIDTRAILDKIKTAIERQGGDEDDHDDYLSIQNNLKYQIYNKIKILEKLLQSEMANSKKEQIKFLIEKMKNNEDLKIEDLRTLDSYYHEGNRLSAKLDSSDLNSFSGGNNCNSNSKNTDNPQNDSIFGFDKDRGKIYLNSNNNQNLFANADNNFNKNAHENLTTTANSDIKNIGNAGGVNDVNANINSHKALKTEADLLSDKSEIINLREEAEANKDDNTSEWKEAEEENRSSYLTKSIIFEKCLKENVSSNNDLKKSIVPSNRVSLSDNYYSVLVSNAHKSEVIKSIFKKAENENVVSSFDKKEKKKEEVIEPIKTPTSNNNVIGNFNSDDESKDKITNKSNNLIEVKIDLTSKEKFKNNKHEENPINNNNKLKEEPMATDNKQDQEQLLQVSNKPEAKSNTNEPENVSNQKKRNVLQRLNKNKSKENITSVNKNIQSENSNNNIINNNNINPNNLSDNENKQASLINPSQKQNLANINKEHFKDSFFANSIQSTISNIVSNINDKLDAAKNLETSRGETQTPQDTNRTGAAAHLKNLSANIISQSTNIDSILNSNNSVARDKSPSLAENPIGNLNSNLGSNNNKIDELKLLISNTNKYVEDVDIRYKGNQQASNELSKSKELQNSQSSSNINNYFSNPISSRVNRNNNLEEGSYKFNKNNNNNLKNNSGFNNNDFENFLNANSVPTHFNNEFNIYNKNNNNSLIIDEGELSRSLIVNCANAVPEQKMNNLINPNLKRFTAANKEEESFDEENHISLFLENCEKENKNEISDVRNQNVFKNNLQDSTGLASAHAGNTKQTTTKDNTNNGSIIPNIDYIPESRFSNVKFDADLNNQLNKINEVVNKIQKIDNIHNNKVNEINEEIPCNDNSIIFNNQINLNKETALGQNTESNLQLSNSNTHLNTFAKISVSDKIINESIMGNLKVHEFQKSQIDSKNFTNNHKDTNDFGNSKFEISDSRFDLSASHSHVKSDFYNYNALNKANKNLDELKNNNITGNNQENLIVINASEFSKNRDNKKLMNKEKEFLNRRNLNKFISTTQKDEKDKDKLTKRAESNSIIISDNNNSNDNSNNNSLINSNNNLKDKSKNKSGEANNAEKDVFRKLNNRNTSTDRKNLAINNNFLAQKDSNTLKQNKIQEELDIDIIQNSKGKGPISNKRKPIATNIMKNYKKSEDEQNSNINSTSNYDSNINYSVNIQNSNSVLKTNNSNVDLNTMLNQLNNMNELFNENYKANNQNFNDEDVLMTKKIMRKLNEIYNNLDCVLKNNNIKTNDINNQNISNDKNKDINLELYLEKYSNLLVQKFEEKLNKK